MNGDNGVVILDAKPEEKIEDVIKALHVIQKTWGAKEIAENVLGYDFKQNGLTLNKNEKHEVERLLNILKKEGSSGLFHNVGIHYRESFVDSVKSIMDETGDIFENYNISVKE